MGLTLKDTKKSRVTLNGKPILSKKVKSEEPITKKKIEDEIKQLQASAKAQKKTKYDLVITLKYDFGWRSGKMFDLADGDIDLFDPADYYIGDDQEFKKKSDEK